MDLSSVNALSYKDFVDVFGNVVEKCPIVAAAVWTRRPFASLSQLEAAINEFIDALPESGKEGALRCFNVLGCSGAGRESTEEQSKAGLDALDPAEASLLLRLNARYTDRFGFPFVICARMNDKATIIRQLSECCGNEHAHERARGIEEAKKICRLRVQDLVRHDAQEQALP